MSMTKYIIPTWSVLGIVVSGVFIGYGSNSVCLGLGVITGLLTIFLGLGTVINKVEQYGKVN